METKYVKNENLCKMANNIFGDIVKQAYIEVYYEYGSSFLDDIIRESDEEKIKGFDRQTGHTLEWGQSTIVLEFINGNFVEFTNSEWAYMENVNQLFNEKEQ